MLDLSGYEIRGLLGAGGMIFTAVTTSDWVERLESQDFDVSRDGHRFLMLKPQRIFEPIPLSGS